MKKKISIPLVLLCLLIAGLLISLVFNCIQYDRSMPSVPVLRGSYSTDSAGMHGRYLVFDMDGHFCLYSQTDGILEEGNYAEYGVNLYRLESTSGNYSSILLTEEGVYYSSADGTLELFSRFSDTPTFIGNWAKDWKNWPEGSYEIKAD